MTAEEEIVFEILGEGGSLTIVRRLNNNVETYHYNHSENDRANNDLDISENGIYDNFEKPFKIISKKYPWFLLYPQTIHPDFKILVLDNLITQLNKRRMTPSDFENSRTQLEEILGVKLKYGNPPLRDGLQKIKVKNLFELTEYDYQEFTDEYAQEIGQKFKLRGKYKMWTDEQTFYPENMEVMRASDNFETVGILEVSGNTIIIKNEFGQIVYAFPSDKFFVSTTPLLSQTKGWFYK
jgi:hypothetical protein